METENSIFFSISYIYYFSECEHKGKIYSNGERLETSPGDECKVCYCRGGEIKCADVSCYVRNDCEGKQVPGQCCPKYDHCPTRGNTLCSVFINFHIIKIVEEF